MLLDLGITAQETPSSNASFSYSQAGSKIHEECRSHLFPTALHCALSQTSKLHTPKAICILQLSSPFIMTEKPIHVELQLPANDDSVSLKKPGRSHERE